VSTLKRKSNQAAKKVAARLIAALAYTREDFKNKIELHLVGAIVEFYRARLAKKNAQPRWVDLQMSEVKSLIEHKLVYEIIHPIRGFKDRRRAYEQAVSEIKAGDKSYRKYAATSLKKDFKLTKLTLPLDDGDTERFWKCVDDVADTAQVRQVKTTLCSLVAGWCRRSSLDELNFIAPRRASSASLCERSSRQRD
jgi:hypothetical protein